jgi:hypothetical protein
MRRRLIFLLALVVAVAAGVASASAITAQMGDDVSASFDPADVQPDGSGAVVPVTTADPDGRAPYALRVYRSKSGRTCPEVGHAKDGRFGQVDAGDGFHAVDLQPAGACADLTKDPVALAVNHYPANGKRPARAVVFGATTDAVASVTLSLATGAQPLKVKGNAYMAVVRDDALKGGSLDVGFADGTTKSYALAPASAPETIPADAVTESSPG